MYPEFDLSLIQTISLKDRKNKVSISDFAKISYDADYSFKDFWNSLPNILGAQRLKELVEKIKTAKTSNKPVIWFMGAHNIKVGLNPMIIDMMQMGYITALGLNGAGSIHDVELAMIGGTSEDVGAGIKEGIFGMSEETADFINGAISSCDKDNLGFGEILGKALAKSNFEYKEYSILFAAYRHKIPVTVHIAIGTDITHIHPSFNASLAGNMSHRDFKIMVNVMKDISDGGVIINAGSSVILPLIVEKGLSVLTSAGYNVKNFTGANLDFIQHYRPNLNPVQRAVEHAGKGITLTGHHEILFPLIYWALKCC